MNFLEWIVPREKRFFRMLADESAVIVKGTEELKTGFANGGISATAASMKAIEAEGDKVVHSLFAELNKTFITPIDHQDLSSLATLMDDVLDDAYEASVRAEMYGIRQLPLPLTRLTGLLNAMSHEMHQAVKAMEHMHADEIHARCLRIKDLQEESQGVLRQGLQELFRQKEAIEIIKLKEIYEDVEHAIDRCEDVSVVLGDIVMKNR